mmetsp:Transcript_46666/g.120336  ORF Transcript_46666/g.120336 Transcript_46666/m.120336 type:complete len:112 (+) Transcript_46666:216-551(+)
MKAFCLVCLLALVSFGYAQVEVPFDSIATVDVQGLLSFSTYSGDADCQASASSPCISQGSVVFANEEAIWSVPVDLLQNDNAECMHSVAFSDPTSATQSPMPWRLAACCLS